MKSDRVVVSNSKIDGKGVFASKDFKEGDIILRWDTSNKISEVEYNSLKEKDQEYISFIDNQYIIMKSPERYVNHSCEPNTNVNNYCDVAIKDIKKGEEITSNYLDNLPPKTFMKCNCGSKKCKGFIQA